LTLHDAASVGPTTARPDIRKLEKEQEKNKERKERKKEKC
jgi:hypothetical protein